MIPSDEKGPRLAGLERNTRETQIQIELNLDGDGSSDIRIEKDEPVDGVPFLAHMLDSFARFGDFGLTVRAAGDFTHHIWEDTGIVLGRTLRAALQGRAIQRTGHAVLAMDDALVLVAVDLIDRPHVEIELPEECELLEHVLRSFALESRITLHTMMLRGTNSHHIVEATFKALGQALHLATRPAGELKSTKKSVEWTEWSADALRKRDA
jgi:imidazoleglycerol-phosphate dehydratase